MPSTSTSIARKKEKLIKITTSDEDVKKDLSALSMTVLLCFLAYQIMNNLFPKHIYAMQPPKKPNESPVNPWTASQILFLKAFVAALTSGLGGFPLYFVGELPLPVMGFCIIFAAGLMSGCSVILFLEALEAEPAIIYVIIYSLIGMLVIHLISHVITDVEDFEFAGLKGKSASKALLIVLSMCFHSLGEGISVGVSATAKRENIGLLVIISLAIHNIPEGIAVSLLLMSHGMDVWTSSLCAVISNIPQPLIAIPAFIFLESFTSLLPIGYGVAAGAMTYIVCTELIPEAANKISRPLLLSTFFTSLGFIVSIAYYCPHWNE